MLSELTCQAQEMGVLPSYAPGPTCFVIARGGLIPQRNSLCVTAHPPLA